MASSKTLPPLTAPFFPNIFVRNQFLSKPLWPPKSTDLSGKVAIITGGNTGLGLESARQLLSYGLSRVILAVRSESKGEAAAAELRASYAKVKIEVWPLDMASYDSIQEFARRADRDLSRLDITILNAGLRKASFNLVPGTKHEEDIQINYLSTMLLAILMLPILKSKSPADSPGRLSIVNAALSHTAKFLNRNEQPLLPSFDDPKHFDVSERYCVSKLLAHMFIWNLADYVSADDVIVNLVDPGFVMGTELSRDLPRWVVSIASVIARLVARNIKTGASTYIDSVLIKGKESHGSFLMSWQVQPFANMVYSEEGGKVRERLWKETMEEFSFANVQSILDSMKNH